MIERLEIANFKSIQRLELHPGRVTVLIGENGAGKSNLLEAIAFGSAALGNKLDNEFLASRGIRVTDARFMRSAFQLKNSNPISITFVGNDETLHVKVSSDESDGPYPNWQAARRVPDGLIARVIEEADVDKTDTTQVSDEFAEQFFNAILERSQEPIPPGKQVSLQATKALLIALFRAMDRSFSRLPSSKSFVIYQPEASSLRTFAVEGQILPLGVRGEGLFRLLGTFGREGYAEQWKDLADSLRLLDWLKEVHLPDEEQSVRRSIFMRDRFLDAELGVFDQRSANEAFLFLLFYLALFVSPDTPEFFAVDHIESSLNPKLCTQLTRRLVLLAKKYGKQVLITTHNPAVLDGLDLSDDEQRLFVVRRSRQGDTRLRRVGPPQPEPGQKPIKLSEAFLRGLLGGVPQNF